MLNAGKGCGHRPWTFAPVAENPLLLSPASDTAAAARSGVAAANVRVMDDEVDLSELPPEFHDLIPLMKEWAIGDDVERDEKMQAASEDELRTLSRALQPRFDAINSYLDDNDHLEVATYLGRLAEAAAEAQIDLENRTG